RTLPVPLERTRYDPDTGLLWVEINPQRLPRGFTFSRLRGEGLQEKIMEAFHRRVVVMQYGQSIIIASLLKLPSKTPGHMKGYTFGTSDFVKADIQPRAVPAT
ncbi:MAG: hypothetical protein KDF65_16905, partial [Anaerolineae bacterium]|nr:hypothetical protein [Anaerolineae bacterium]